MFAIIREKLYKFGYDTDTYISRKIQPHMAKRVRKETSFSGEQYQKVQKTAKDEGINPSALIRRATILYVNAVQK